MTKEKQNLEEELAKIKSEMNEIKELLKSKKSDPDFEVEYTSDNNSWPRKPRIPRKPRSSSRKIFGTDDFDFEEMDELGSTMDHYVENILSGVEKNLKHSLGKLSNNFGISDAKRAARNATREADRAVKMAKKSIRKQEREIRLKEKTLRKRMERRYQPLADNELESFLELGPNLAGSLADVRRLMILKELEIQPHYPTELAEKLNFKGGALKNHLDNLVGINYISQEAVRGRYLITQLGMEALKLVEMLFRRYTYNEKIKSGEYNDFIDENTDNLHDINFDMDDEVNNKTSEVGDIDDELNDNTHDVSDRSGDIENSVETKEEEY